MEVTKQHTSPSEVAMIIDRYERPVDIPTPALTDPVLNELDALLDDPILFDLVRRDLQKHYKPSKCGHPPVPVEVSLRVTVLRRRKKWSYRQTEQEVRNHPGYRWWVRVYQQRVPDHSTLNDLERVIQPKTLHQINERLLVLAQERRLTQGYKLRVDSTVTESHIHHPTDSSLLVDGVRVLSRLLERARPWLPQTLVRQGVCSNHLRSARRRGRQIGNATRKAKHRPAASKHARAKKSL
jgi:IS5 family transposase